MISDKLIHPARRPLLLLCITGMILFLTSTEGFSQTPGKGTIKGTVVDSRTKDGLPNVNITVKGTNYGTVSSIDGKFTVTGINPSTYTVEASLLGYKTVQFTGVKVIAGETVPLDIKMDETVLSLGQEVVIIGEKPMFDIEETQSTRTIRSDDIKIAAVQTVKDVIGMQTGVVQADDEIHIRGGRGYENAYLLDGISVQDQLGGKGFGLQLSPGAIQEAEVITGGYNAEYGQATSGIVNITTKEGSTRYNGSLEYKRDHFGFNDDSRSNQNTDIYEMSLSGPEPLTTDLLPSMGVKVPGTVSFFGTFYGNFTDGYTRWADAINSDGVPTGGYVVKTPNQLYSSLFMKGGDYNVFDPANFNTFLAPRASNNWSWMSKLTYKPSATLKLSYTYTSSIVIDQNSQTIASTLEHVEPNPGYQYIYQDMLDSANTFTQRNIQHAFSLTHTLSPKTFYEIKLSQYTAHVRGDANGKSYTQYTEPKDIVTLPIAYYNVQRDTIGVVPGDGFYDVGSPTTYRDHFLKEFTVKGDLTHNFTEKNKFKTGIEMRFQDMQMVDLNSPWYKPLGSNYDIYEVFPALGALYAQENVTLKGMILNFGLRFDYWLPGKFVDDIMSLPSDSINVSPAIQQAYFDDSFNLFGRRWKARISPRLGISHPVSDNQTLFFSYGHFSKLPRPQFVYSKLEQTAAKSSFQTVGNPDLNPETTVSYELGLRNQLTESMVLTLTAYYKDIFDYITARYVRTQNARFSGGSYTTYINQDYSRVRGVELEWKYRYSDWFKGALSGSYSLATGKSSSSDEAVYNLQTSLIENIKEYPMVFDRPWQFSLNLNFISKPNQPLLGFAPGILDDYNLFMRVFFENGKRYTEDLLVGYDAITGRPQYVPDYQHPYSKVSDNWFYIDLNFEKYFDVSIGKLVLSLEVQNLLDRKKSQIINNVTGRAYEYGDPTEQSVNDPQYRDLTYPVSTFPYNPARYLTPRTFRAGLAFRF